MENKKTLMVCLFAGPGTGKSTGAAYVFSQLKMAGVNAELITEYAKDAVYRHDMKVFENQFYVVGKQSFRESKLKGQVDVIVTDSPALMGAIYSMDKPYYKEYVHVLRCMHEEYKHFNYFLKRTKPYNPKGRFQDEDGAKALDATILKFLDDQGLTYKTVEGNATGYEEIVDDVQEYLGQLIKI